MTAAASGPGPNDVHVHVAEAAPFAADQARVARALAWLSPDERERAARFRHEADRAMFLLGRAMARTLVGRALGVHPSDWTWRDGPHGRPEVAAPATDLRFNLSHSAGLVLCALADGRDVGVDVEHLDRRAPDRLLVRRYCSPREADDVESRGDAWLERFLTYWTLKEAYLKARGLGISVALADLGFELSSGGPIHVVFGPSLLDAGGQWHFHLWYPSPRHLAAVAVSTPDDLALRITTRSFA